MSKSLFVESTKVPIDRTIGLIHKMLADHGAEAIMSEYEDSQINGMAFRIVKDGRTIAFRLPCRWRAILKLFKYRAYGPDDEARARRIAWRQVYWWLKAQLSLVDTEMVQLTEVFLPYAQHTTGETVYERIQQQEFQALSYEPPAPRG